MHPPGRRAASGGLDRPPPVGAAVWDVGPVVDHADIPVLCGQLATLVRDRGATVVVCDVGRMLAPDAVAVEALARLQLTARRLGCDLRIRGAGRRLRELVALAGLDAVLAPGGGLRGQAVRARGQAEQREQPVGVEEGVDPPDPAG